MLHFSPQLVCFAAMARHYGTGTSLPRLAGSKTDKTKLFSTGAMMLRCCQTKFRDINRDCFREAEAL